RMQGQYTLEGRRIKIAPGAATLAECGPGSRYAEYLRYLSDAVSFILHEKKLMLNLMTEGESLVFGHGGEVPESHRY
ncbi:MAG: META domain-containing protein, partial [Gammaproteobacteria bacterium]